MSFDPHWVTLNGWAAAEPLHIGVSFLCPHCPIDYGNRKRLVVLFSPPIDPANWIARMLVPLAPQMLANVHSRLSGETFNSLTIDPSIGFDQIGHFHGRITNGVVEW